MLTRIVKMTFRPENVNDFLAAFDRKKVMIASFEGCKSVKLLRDISNTNTFFTYSEWIDENALEKYRTSELFISTWDEVKKFFGAKPLAWSVRIID